MKKRLILIILALVIAVSATACSSNTPKVSGQDTSYAVTSNGGMAVGYGNYVYFVNGYRDTSDPDGINNKFGDVVQGGIFRAELIAADTQAPSTYPIGVKSFTPSDIDLPFKITNDVNNPYYYFNLDGSPINTDDEIIEHDTEEQPFKIDEVNVEQVVSKSVSADAYGNGGLFIFGDYIYYASRNNEENKNGVIQSDLYDFFRVKVTGGSSDKIYTTTSGDNIQYAFYNYKGDVYLVVHEGTKLTSVKVSRKIQSPVTIAENVANAVLPIKETYHRNISENTIYDYIFFSRSVDDDDTQKTGVIGECIRPDGSSRMEILYNQTSLSFLAVRDDSVYYTDTLGLNTRLVRSSPNFADGLVEGEIDLAKSVVLNSTSSFTNIYPFREKHANGYSASETVLFTTGGKLVLSRGGDLIDLVDGTVTILTVSGGFVYYLLDNNMYRVSLAVDLTNEKAAERAVTTSTFFKIDFVSGMMFYTASTRFDWAPNYVYTKKVSSYVNTDEIFIGKIEQENPDIAVHEEHDEENHYDPEE